MPYSHLWNLITMWSLHKGGLFTEVVSLLSHLSSLRHNYYVVFVQRWSLEVVINQRFI